MDALLDSAWLWIATGIKNMAQAKRNALFFLRPVSLTCMPGKKELRKGLWWSALCLLLPHPAHAIQMHRASEGILVHQLGHLFFLVSMGILIFTIQGKKLHLERGWRLIQYSALFFILWNLDAMAGHFLDNQLNAVSPVLIGMTRIQIMAPHHGQMLGWAYYLLRLDHLFCLPAMILLYRGLSHLVNKGAP